MTLLEAHQKAVEVALEKIGPVPTNATLAQIIERRPRFDSAYRTAMINLVLQELREGGVGTGEINDFIFKQI